MPSASSYTNKIRFSSNVKNTKAQLPGGVGNLTQGMIAGCGLELDYSPIDYTQNCRCDKYAPKDDIPIPSQIMMITTFAGTNMSGYFGDGLAASVAKFSDPVGLALDLVGNLYIADSANGVIRKVNPAGIITTVAGNGSSTGYSGDNDSAISAQLSLPYGVAVDSDRNVYIADSYNHVIRKVDSSSGIITTVAGLGTAGYSGDNGDAISAELSYPFGIALDSDRNVYIGDTGNHVIRKVDSSSGIITTVAGLGSAGYLNDPQYATEAQLSGPFGIAVDLVGNLYIADTNNHVIRKVNSSGIITTVAGNNTSGYSGDNGPAISAQLYTPQGVAVDLVGNLYIADTNNHVIRKVNPAGIITTVAGNNTSGYSGNNTPAVNAQLSAPYGVTIDPSGRNLYIADTYNQIIRKVVLY